MSRSRIATPRCLAEIVPACRPRAPAGPGCAPLRRLRRERAVVDNGHLYPGMEVLTKPLAMDGLAARIRGCIED